MNAVNSSFLRISGMRTPLASDAKLIALMVLLVLRPRSISERPVRHSCMGGKPSASRPAQEIPHKQHEGPAGAGPSQRLRLVRLRLFVPGRLSLGVVGG